MPVLNIEDIKTEIYTPPLTDTDLSNIVNRAYSNVLRSTGVTDDSSSNIQLAIEYTAFAMIKRKLKDMGVLAASIKTGNAQRQNTADKDIDDYQARADAIINPYRDIQQSAYSSPSCHAGFDHCSGGHHGHY
jgi:hypothetical protein